MASSNRKRPNKSITLHLDVVELVKAKAIEEGRSFSQIIERCLEANLRLDEATPSSQMKLT